MAEFADAGLRPAIYARVSTEEQREGQTIDSQVAELERFAREKGWPVFGVYRDDGWSGGVMERPELDRLRDDAQRKLFNAVLINDVDRLARDVAHLGVIKRDLEKKGAKVIFRKLPSDASPTSNLMVNILGSFAEFERELIADRTRRGRRHKVEVRQEYLGSNTSFGYQYTRMDRVSGRPGSLQVNPAEAMVVRQMFEWVDSEGLSARRVTIRLNERHIPPKKGAPRWGKSSVLRILKNEMYAGIWHYNKHQGCEPRATASAHVYRRNRKCSKRQRPRTEWIPLTLPDELRIVRRDRWNRVQRQLAQNLSFSPRNEKHKYLLKGLIRCGGCGGRFVGDPCHGRFFYRCIARCRKIPTIAEARIDEAVKQAVTRFLVDPEIILSPLRKLNEASSRGRADSEMALQDAQRELGRITSEEGRLLEAYRTAIITPAQLGHQLEQLTKRKTALEVQCANAEQFLPMNGERDVEVSSYCATAAANLSGFNTDQWRELLRTVIAEIVLGTDLITIHGRIPVGAPTGLGFSGTEFSIDESRP